MWQDDSAHTWSHELRLQMYQHYYFQIGIRKYHFNLNSSTHYLLIDEVKTTTYFKLRH